MIEYLINNMKHLYFSFAPKLRPYALLLLFGLFATGMRAQTYCGASNSWGCGLQGSQDLSGDMDEVSVKNSAGGTLASYTGISCSGGGLTVLNTGSPFDVTSGETLTYGEGSY
jgi:hypothetical protein